MDLQICPSDSMEINVITLTKFVVYIFNNTIKTCIFDIEHAVQMLREIDPVTNHTSVIEQLGNNFFYRMAE